MRDRVKQLGKLLLQGAVSGALIFWLVSNRDLRQQLEPALAHADGSWLLAAFLVYGAVEFLGAIRWQLFLRAFGFRLSWWEATRILLIGIFFNTLLPGLIAGDALRAMYLSKRFAGKGADAVLVVFVERFFGLIGLMVVGVSMMLWRYRWLHLSAITGHLTDLTLVVVGIGLVAGLVCLLIRQRSSPAHPRNHHLGGSVLFIALMTTVAAHLCYAASFYCSGEAFASSGPSASCFDMLAITPIVNTFTSLPISFSGIGVRESLLQVFLNDLCGVPTGVAVLIGSLGFLIRALWAVLGCAFLAGCHRLQWREWTEQLLGHRETHPEPASDHAAFGELCRRPVSTRSIRESA